MGIEAELAERTQEAPNPFTCKINVLKQWQDVLKLQPAVFNASMFLKNKTSTQASRKRFMSSSLNCLAIGST